MHRIESVFFSYCADVLEVPLKTSECWPDKEVLGNTKRVVKQGTHLEKLANGARTEPYKCHLLCNANLLFSSRNLCKNSTLRSKPSKVQVKYAPPPRTTADVAGMSS